MPPKPVFKTGIPFSETKWPALSAASQEIILELLCSILEPIGLHRQAIQPSKGKTRTKKRKRNTSAEDALAADSSPPPLPDISRHVLVGLNSVSRHLSELAAQTAPPGVPAAQKAKLGEDQEPTVTELETAERHQSPPLRPLSILILPHPVPTSSLPHAHIPTLIYLSTMKTEQPTRLVTLPTAAESKLASTLHLPRVGAIGILEGAPGAANLVEYVRDHVGLVECKWIEEGMKAEWRGVRTGTSK